MKALAVVPGRAHSLHLIDVPKPTLDEVPAGRGVLVRVLRVGVDGTDKEIDAAEYGQAPPGDNYLITGHEGFGVIEAVGPAVTELTAGDFVVATVRRPGSSLYDRIGTSDMTTDDVYFERGINLRHGYLAEYYVDDADFIVRVPAGLKEVGVLLEPMTVVEKGIAQAYEIQRRLRVWRPKRAAVMGAGTIGLLAALVLRLRGLDVTVFGLRPAPYLNADLLAMIGARYVSTAATPVIEASRAFGPFDIIFEATGFSPVVFDSMQALGKNGVLVLSSVTGGDRRVEAPADRINLEFVLGNKVMVGTVNANREYFERGVEDMALAEAEFPGWLSRLLTHPITGLERYRELVGALTSGTDVIKAFCQVAPPPAARGSAPPEDDRAMAGAAANTLP
ncbi:MAG TPA: glucose 1-dehydrogenase [Vicinamibacterales bacterium]|jgi:threonine dehydrogenase-like Zn-dependent dehydrogenase|nr:glucose 1-dehydrogenase [Vicinamibacterales bacterium]